MHNEDTDDLAYVDGHDQGYLEADDFIERHPNGMPWSALPDDEPDPPEGDFDRGYGDGWTKRMKEEGWPTSRREVRNADG